MMHCMFAPPRSVFVDHETSLIITTRLDAPLHSFTHPDVFAINYLRMIVEHSGFGLARRVRQAVQIEVLHSSFRTGRNHMEDEKIRRGRPGHEQSVRPEYPNVPVLDRIGCVKLIGDVIGPTAAHNVSRIVLPFLPLEGGSAQRILGTHKQRMRYGTVVTFQEVINDYFPVCFDLEAIAANEY